jgi:pimeloyl-ACP methyl ester carboxylesterase
MHIVLNLFQAFLLIVALTVIVSYVLLKYELDNRKDDAAARGERIGARDAILGIIGEIGAAVICIVLYPFGWLPERVLYPGVPPGEKPLVLCHGYLHNRSAFLFIGYRLRRAGLKNLIVPNFRPASASVAQFAERLSEAVEYAISQTGCTEVDIVGHSMGGLVVRHYIEHCGGSSRVGKAVMLGSPVHGTKMAVLSPLTTARQFRIDSPLVAGAGNSDPSWDSVEVVSIWSDFDNIVIPPENARVPEPGKNIVVRGVGHLALLFSGQVFFQLKKILLDAQTEQR